MRTQKKLSFLRNHAKVVFKEIKMIDSENITGYKIDKKKSGTKTGSRYSLVIHVAKKFGKDDLKDTKIIPESIKVRFPDNIVRTIKTDVVETGRFTFQSGIGGRVTSTLSPPGSYGSPGLFVTDDNHRSLMITNYHVAAGNLMAQGKNDYVRNPSDTSKNIRLITTQGKVFDGSLDRGRISDTIDVAFVIMPTMPPAHGINVLGNGVNIQGKILTDPTPSALKGKNVVIFSVHNPLGLLTTIVNESVTIDDHGAHFEEVIQLPKVTIGGDSGGILITTNYLALGLIIGADDNFSYAIPYYQIEYFKPTQIL